MSDKRSDAKPASDRETERSREDGKGKGAKGRAAGDAPKKKKTAPGGAETETGRTEAKQGTDEAGSEQDGTGSGPETGESGDLRYMRLAADFQNYKKRTEKEKSEIYAYANAKFATDLLEVLDNFERAIGDAAERPTENPAEGSNETFLAGMEMIRAQLINVLKKNDVEEIAAVGEVFDPNVHHAVMMEASETYESGQVTCVMQKGYRLREKVIRPAMVKVAE
ncbi:MAG: nucleotide exchange factor GrpE [Clostridiales Family XIII bacterium]|jgi:molecular chaperone GrpE|nr:nucleotide exchange factor GrpE [Clostridiales Family XIII bacterium]